MLDPKRQLEHQRYESILESELMNVIDPSGNADRSSIIMSEAGEEEIHQFKPQFDTKFRA